MKKIICISIFTLLVSTLTSYGQSISLSEDSIMTLLTKKWEVDYAVMGGMKIGKIPGASDINYDFKKDKTFLMSSNNPNDKAKGTWKYDPKKKLIKLTVNGKTNTIIVSLKDNELIMQVDTKEATPDDPMEIKLVYKIKA